jgi:hypothetical protein
MVHTAEWLIGVLYFIPRVIYLVVMVGVAYIVTAFTHDAYGRMVDWCIILLP